MFVIEADFGRTPARQRGSPAPGADDGLLTADLGPAPNIAGGVACPSLPGPRCPPANGMTGQLTTQHPAPPGCGHRHRARRRGVDEAAGCGFEPTGPTFVQVSGCFRSRRGVDVLVAESAGRLRFARCWPVQGSAPKPGAFGADARWRAVRRGEGPRARTVQVTPVNDG